LKFKFLIIAFNIIIVFFLFIIIILPSILTGYEAAANMRYFTLPLSVLLILLLAGLNVFSLSNYRLFSLLDREDWPALVYYLEQKIYVKGGYSSRKVKLLASCYLVISDYSSVIALEGKTLLAKPALIEKNALIFGAARVLSGNYKAAAAFFRTRLDQRKKLKNEQWVIWFYGFSQMLAGVYEAAEQEFTSLATSSQDAIVTGLSAYFLHNNVAKYSLKPADCRAAAEKGRDRVVNTLINVAGWKKAAAKTETDVHITIIKKYIDEAGAFLWA
jgi:hypothetical protein